MAQMARHESRYINPMTDYGFRTIMGLGQSDPSIAPEEIAIVEGTNAQ